MINICRPLFDNFGLTFGYMRFFDDGRILRISSQLGWTRKYYDLGLYQHPQGYHSEINRNLLNNQDKIFWVGEPKNPLHSALYDYGIWNNCNILERLPDSFVCYFFGSKPENTSMAGFYLNNIDLLKHFILYFNDKASDILDPSDSRKIIKCQLTLLSESSEKNYQEHPFDKSKTDLFFEQTKIKRYFLATNANLQVHLTRREFECLQLLSKGKSLKEIGKVIHLSPRTIETHINNIKFKTRLHAKSDLTRLIHNFR